MADKKARVLLQYATDKSALRDTLADSGRLRQEMRLQAEAAKQVDLATVKVGKSIRDAFSSQSTGKIAQFAGNMKGAVQSADSLTAAIEKAAEAQNKLGGGGGNKLESLDRLATATQRGLSGVGLGGVGAQVVGGVGDFAQLAQDFPKIKDAIKDIPGAISEVVNSVGKGGAGLIGAIGLLTLVTSLAQKQFEETARAAKEELDARQQALDLIRTGTKEEIQSRIDTLKAQQTADKARADQANQLLAQFRQGIANDPTAKFFSGLIEVGAQLGIGAGQLKSAETAASDANAALGKTNTELDLLQQQQATGVTTTADLAAAEKELADTRKQTTERSIQYILEQTKLEQDAGKLTVDQNKQRQSDLENQISLIAQEIQIRQASGDASEENNKKLDELALQFAQLSTQESYLAGTGMELAKANDELAASDKKRADSIAAVQKFNNDTAAIEQRVLEQRAALQDKYNQSLITIAQQAADAAANALQKLEDQRAKLLQDFQRNEADEQKKAELERQDKIINFQRDEAKALRDHERDLRKIREDAQEREFDLILNRDFAGLFASRRQTTQDINASNEQFNQERKDRYDAFQQELQDQIDQYVRDREARIAKYQQDLVDAQAQYNKERVQIETNRRVALQKAAQQYQQELSLANQKYTAELSARRTAIAAELQLIQQGAQARLSIEQALVQQYQAILASVQGGGTGSGFQSGGGFTNSGGSTSSTANVNINQTITGGASAQSIASAVDSRIASTLNQIFPQRSGAR